MVRNVLRVALAATALLGSVFFQPALADQRVQLKVFKARASQTGQGKQSIVLITVRLDTKNKSSGKSLCKLAPKYLDVISTHLDRKTYALNNKGALDMDMIQRDLEPVIRKVDRALMILKVEVVQGVQELGKNDVVVNRTGCVLLRKPR
ncbi:MAG: hypothetical protein HQ494_04135 [Rhodospirillales bacterium]|nr:hypothetical protein [Rhodospirillales bacterium]